MITRQAIHSHNTKRVFFEGISAEVREAQDALNSDNDGNASIGGDEMEERTMMDFPVPLEKIYEWVG